MPKKEISLCLDRASFHHALNVSMNEDSLYPHLKCLLFSEDKTHSIKMYPLFCFQKQKNLKKNLKTPTQYKCIGYSFKLMMCCCSILNSFRKCSSHNFLLSSQDWKKTSVSIDLYLCQSQNKNGNFVPFVGP